MKDCEDIHIALARGQTPAGPEVVAHLRQCPTCKELSREEWALGEALHGASAAPGEDPNGLSTLFEAIGARVALDRGPVSWLRTLPTSTRLALGLAALMGWAVLDLALSPRADLSSYPIFRMVLSLSVLGLLGMGALWVALRPLHRPALPASVVWGLALGAGAVPILLATLPEAHGFSALGCDKTCFISGSVVALAAFGLLRVLDRTTSSASIVLSAAAGGVAANLHLQTHCASSVPDHLLAGHAGVAVAFIALGAAFAALRRLWRGPGLRTP